MWRRNLAKPKFPLIDLIIVREALICQDELVGRNPIQESFLASEALDKI